MATFGQRLKNLREEKEMSQQDLANVFTLSQSTIAYYERDKKEPNFDILDKLANYFSVSTDYLLGRSDIRNPFGQMTIAAHQTNPLADLSQENIGKINSFIKFIRNENNEKK